MIQNKEKQQLLACEGLEQADVTLPNRWLKLFTMNTLMIDIGSQIGIRKKNKGICIGVRG